MYSRTVTCSYCYATGHNRRTCDKLREDLRKAAENGCEYSAKKLEGMNKGKSKASRKCSYCGAFGHDRRTCGHKKRHEKMYSRKLIADRELALERAYEIDFGVGSLMQIMVNDFSEGRGTNVPTVGLVKSISWEGFQVGDASRGDERPNCHTRIVCLETYPNMKQVYVELPKEVTAPDCTSNPRFGQWGTVLSCAGSHGNPKSGEWTIENRCNGTLNSVFTAKRGFTDFEYLDW